MGRVTECDERMRTWNIILNCDATLSPPEAFQALTRAKMKDYFDFVDIKICIDSPTKCKNSDICRSIVELCREKIVHLDMFVDVYDYFLKNISMPKLKELFAEVYVDSFLKNDY